MSWHPIADTVKVLINGGGKYAFLSPSKVGEEKGIVVEMPEKLHYFGKHSMIIEQSFMAEDLDKLLAYYTEKFLGKPVAWESLQDRGRHFKEGDDGTEYVYLKISDILAVGDEVADLEDTEMSDDDRANGGSFSL